MVAAFVAGEGGVFVVDVAVGGAEHAVGLGVGVVAFPELLALLDNVAICYGGPIFDGVECLVVENQDAGAFEGGESHEGQEPRSHRGKPLDWFCSSFFSWSF